MYFSKKDAILNRAHVSKPENKDLKQIRSFLYDVPTFGPQIWELGNFSVMKRILTL